MRTFECCPVHGGLVEARERQYRRAPGCAASLLIAQGHPSLASRGIDVEQQLAMLGDGARRRRVVGAAAAGDDPGIEDTEVRADAARRGGTAEHLDAEWRLRHRAGLCQAGLQQRPQ